MRRLGWLAVLVVVVGGCGEDEGGGGAPASGEVTSNGTASGTGDGTTATSNGTTGSGTSDGTMGGPCGFGAPGCVCTITAEGATESGKPDGDPCTLEDHNNGYCDCSRPVNGSAPAVANLSYASPGLVRGTLSTLNIVFDYSDLDADAVEFTVQVNDPDGGVVLTSTAPTPNSTGGLVETAVEFTPVFNGPYDLSIWVTDGAGHDSEVLTRPFQVGPGDPLDTYRYVLIEDLSHATPGENAPGADIDAVGVVRSAVERFASTVDGDNVVHDGEFADTTRALGAPDSGCEAINFVALGGVENGGYIIFGFDDGETRFTFGPGDIVNVYELGPSSCSNHPEWVDDSYAVSVSVGNTKDQFTDAGRAVQQGVNSFIVP